MYYVYVLRNDESSKLYIGYSHNLRQRVSDHSRGKVTTTKNGGYTLIYYEAYVNKADALGREKFLKGGSGRKYLNKQLAHFFSETMQG